MATKRISRWWLCLLLSLALVPWATFAQDFKEVDEYLAVLNDEEIPFNESLIELGSPQAKLTATLVYGISGDTSYFVKSILPGIISKYVDSGQMRITVVELPLSLHDVQAFSAFRCVEPARHWELLRRVAIRDERSGYQLKNGSYLKAPDVIWGMMSDFGLERKKAEQCMRNSHINGYVDGLRRGVEETFQVSVVPRLVIGKNAVIPSNSGIVKDAIEAALKESKP
jgi:Thioredoxin